MKSGEAQKIPKQPLHNIWLGDFNRHHQAWDDLINLHLFTASNERAAEFLLELVADHNLVMTLEPGVPTLQALSTGNYTRVDNVFCSSSLVDYVVRCETTPERRQPKTDHIPIITEVALEAKKRVEETRPDWKRTKWKKLSKKLEEELRELGEPKEIETEEEFWERRRDWKRVIQKLVNDEELILKTKMTPYQRRWWNKTLDKLRKKCRKLGKKSYRKRFEVNNPIHEAFRVARQKYSAEIKNAKAEKWAEWLKFVDEAGLWDVASLVEKGPTD
ncbi:hypothetical protein K435DRAFT_665386, partial [Dendrothele bispora CBS 962.96]